MQLKRYALPLVVSALIGYPFYGALLWIADTTFGTRQLLHWITFESKHALLQQELNDILASASISLPIILLTSLIALFSWYNGRAKLRIAAFVGITIIPMLIFSSLGFAPAQGIIFTLVILLSAVAATLSSRILRHANY